ncbi:hypothetical protein KDK77_05750, partial [bacterium]|nr:hypothetical protein [bacterium]
MCKTYFYIAVFIFFINICGVLNGDDLREGIRSEHSAGGMSTIDYITSIIPTDSFKIIDWSDELS